MPQPLPFLRHVLSRMILALQRSIFFLSMRKLSSLMCRYKCVKIVLLNFTDDDVYYLKIQLKYIHTLQYVQSIKPQWHALQVEFIVE